MKTCIREENSKKLHKECAEIGIAPIPLAEYIVANPEDYTGIEVWMSSNYLIAHSCMRVLEAVCDFRIKNEQT